MSEPAWWFLVFSIAAMSVLCYVIDRLLQLNSELTSKLMSRSIIEYTEAVKGPEDKNFRPKMNESDIDLNRDIHPF